MPIEASLQGEGAVTAAVEMPDSAPVTAEERVAGAYAAEADRLIALGRMLCGDAHAGEDLAHDVFLDALRSSRRDPAYLREPAWPWLRVVMVRRAMRWRARRVGELRALTRQWSPIPGDEAWSDATVDLVAALRKLPPRMRACVALFYVEDMSVQQIAGALGCAPRTVETQLRGGRGRLASLLGDGLNDVQEDRS